MQFTLDVFVQTVKQTKDDVIYEKLLNSVKLTNKATIEQMRRITKSFQIIMEHFAGRKYLVMPELEIKDIHETLNDTEFR